MFQLLDSGDELTFSRRNDGQVILHTDLPGVPPEQNLIMRAAGLLKKYSTCQQGADITLTKRLPMGGGLGGGSSDAATTLLGLNALWNLQLDIATLAQLSPCNWGPMCRCLCGAQQLGRGHRRDPDAR